MSAQDVGEELSAMGMTERHLLAPVLWAPLHTIARYYDPRTVLITSHISYHLPTSQSLNIYDIFKIFINI